MAYHALKLLVAIFVLFPGQGSGSPAAPPASAPVPASAPSASRPVERRPVSALFLARSDDGLEFSRDTRLFLRNAESPDLLVLPNGDLLAVFDYRPSLFDAQRVSTRPVLSYAASSDGGRTWSAARPLKINGLPADARHPRHARLLAIRDGEVRLYFLVSCTTPKNDAAPAKSPTLQLHGARRRQDGRFVCDKDAPLSLGACLDARTTIGPIGERTHLFAHILGNDRKVTIKLYTRGRSGGWAAAEPPRTDRISFDGDLAAWGDRTRLYFAARGGIRSAVTRDGRTWDLDAGVRMRGAMQPSVVRLKLGGALLLYAAELDETRRDQLELAGVERRDRRTGERDDASASGADADADADMSTDDALGEWADLGELGDAGDEWADAALEWSVLDEISWPDESRAADASAETAQGDSQPPDADDGDAESASEPPAEESPEQLVRPIVEAVPQRDAAAPPIEELLSHAAVARRGAVGPEPDVEAALRDAVAAAAYGFPPKPDFETPIDYVAWFRDHALNPCANGNAYEAYATFMPEPGDQPGDKPEWPQFNDKFNSTEPGLPGPWNPAEHPEWEAAYHAEQPFLAMFRDAAHSHDAYAIPMRFGNGEEPYTFNGERLLIGILLPELSAHRRMAKAAISNAWRTGADGKVDPREMMDAWETTLRSAGHLQQGATLIEQLVAVAEQAFVQQNARWALKHGVFSDDQLEDAMSTLSAFDRPATDPASWVRGEYAMVMDITQYVFTPEDPAEWDGSPRVNTKRVQTLKDAFGGEEMLKEFENLTPDDARRTIETIDTYYRELTDRMRRGYPEVRASDLDALTEEHVAATPITRSLLPALSRAYTLRTRNEASRRATQLSYAVHLFKARNDRWPDSLAELPDAQGGSMTIDPFTGGYFGYRVTENGPIIYSLSENGRDDGGIHARRWNDEPVNGSDDHVFWPPQE